VTRAARVLVAIVITIATIGAQRRSGGDPILVLISFDGWRWDYLDRLPAPNLKALAARGVRAKELVPSFPTFTFPNHYTIVTGLYPGHHGIVHNVIDDVAYPLRFTMSAATAKEGRWWGGEPVWVTAERQGRRAAPIFWPGSEAPIGGVRPTAWLPFDDNVPAAERVERTLELLALPDDRRPSFLTAYFSDVDHAGHESGPDSAELVTAASRLDEAIGQLVDGVRRLGLDDRTTFIVVSDHGMTPTPANRFIFLDDYVDMDAIDFVEMGAFLQLRPHPALLETVYRQLRGRHPHLAIYKREELPPRFHYRDNPRIQPIIGVLDEGWTLTTHSREAGRRPDASPRNGAHGYDPQLPSMHGLFVAAGARVRRGVVAAPFENIHIYDFMCAILNLTPSKNDGDPAVSRPWLVTDDQRGND
jgi:predicted AlkP superfamily pyrophosphatase or phosphodiesterase